MMDMPAPPTATTENGTLAVLARYAASLPAVLPPDAALEARLAFLDTLACMIAGANEPQTRAARAAMEGREDGAAAAMVAGTAAHALDYDDYEVPGSTHPSAVLVPAILGAAKGREVTLDAALRAYAAGYEAIIRLGRGLGYGHYIRGWHATGTLGPVGAALAAATLRGLDAGSTVSAMSLATSMSAGLKAQFGTDAKALHAGLAARAGVEAAALAWAGACAAAGALDGPSGFLAVYGTAESPGAAAMGDGAELALLADRPLRKPWACCAYTQRPIEAALELAGRPGYAAEAVEEAALHMPEPYLAVAGFTDPRTGNEARFSARYCVAVALAEGAVGPGSFAPEAIRREAVQEMLARVTLHPYPLAPGLGDMSPEAPDRLVLRLRGGGTVEATVPHVPGGPALPMTAEQVAEKFTACGGTRSAADTVLGADGATPLREVLAGLPPG